MRKYLSPPEPALLCFGCESCLVVSVEESPITVDPFAAVTGGFCNS